MQLATLALRPLQHTITTLALRPLQHTITTLTCLAIAGSLAACSGADSTDTPAFEWVEEKAPPASVAFGTADKPVQARFVATDGTEITSCTISYDATGDGAVTLSGTGTNRTLHFGKAGSATITAKADCSDDDNYDDPTPLEQPVTATRAIPTFSWATAPTRITTPGDVTISVKLRFVDSNGSPGCDVSFDSGNPAAATIMHAGGTTATLRTVSTSKGITTINASADCSGNPNYANPPVLSARVTTGSPVDPANPTVHGSQIKQLVFDWQDVSDATYYQLSRSGGSHSPDDVSSGQPGFARIVPLYASVGAQYLLDSCNTFGCTPANRPLTITRAQLNRAIGYIKASNTDSGDTFGTSLSLSADGNTLAVGANGEDSNARGVGGDESDNSKDTSGAVYIFTRNTDSTACTNTGNVSQPWCQQAYIKASNTGGGDLFGASLSLSADGNTLAVGAPQEASNATGTGGNQSDNSKGASGAVYIFTRNTGSTACTNNDNISQPWCQQAYIKASNTGGGDLFGASLSLSADGNTLAVGARWENSNAMGTGGDESNNDAANAGAVYVFSRDASTDGNSYWSQQAYIKASNTGSGDDFGYGLSLSPDGNTLAVGARYEDSNVAGISNSPGEWSSKDNNSKDGSGAVYVFSRDASTDGNSYWSQQAYIKASNSRDSDNFGTSLSLSADGNTLAVGANGEDSNATGIHSDELGDGGTKDSGAVYVFTRTSDNWSQQAYIKAINTGSGDDFGYGLSLSPDGSTLAVGANGEDSNATGTGGDKSNNNASTSGAVYLY